MPWVVVLKRVEPLSPQSTLTDHGLSLPPTSLKLPMAKLCGPPSETFWLSGASTGSAVHDVAQLSRNARLRAVLRPEANQHVER